MNKENKSSKFKDFIKNIFLDKKKRHLGTIILIIPFVVIIVIFGLKVYNEAKELLNLASENATSSDDKFLINGGDYLLRDSATDIQKEYFLELKDIYENAENVASNEQKAESIVKNFVADYYTWSNKLGQYDVGGMYYVFTPQRHDIYIQSRDQFYKYINEYINEYGVESLIEVESVEATATHANKPYEVEEMNDETGYTEINEYNTYYVEASWTYVQKETNFKTSSYDTKGYFVVIDRNGRFEIVYAGSKQYEPIVEAGSENE